MKVNQSAIVILVLSLISVSGPACLPSVAYVVGPVNVQTQDPGPPAVARRIGAIKAINGNAITLAPDSGPEVAVTVQPNARLLRIAPGEKDFKNATPVQLQELKVGDTIRVRGMVSDDG